MAERELLNTANHPFVVTMHWSFQTSNCLYFVMDYCGGGEFFRVLQKQVLLLYFSVIMSLAWKVLTWYVATCSKIFTKRM